MARNTKVISTKYYLIYDRIIGKQENYGNYKTKEWLFKAGEWIPDHDFEIMDHLMGYDPSEPPDSPYAIGSTDVLMEMDEISEEQALALIEKEKRNGNRG